MTTTKNVTFEHQDLCSEISNLYRISQEMQELIIGIYESLWDSDLTYDRQLASMVECLSEKSKSLDHGLQQLAAALSLRGHLPPSG